ncbi:L,D-transpeptidase [Bradyrhizobium liaoningense]|uniref:L,D-transpeptidase n=1 Tax=Bradyrhizobium liaoningense TaxID=43992 RepID=UPI00289CD884|nr:L,D-transpeptidase [Bradyrhizobium liaoningense]
MPIRRAMFAKGLLAMQRAITTAVFAIVMLPAGIAHAQFLFGAQHTFWPGQYAPYKHKHHHRQTKSETAPEPLPKGPLQIIISIADQRVSLFDNGALIARSSVSTGMEGHPTPLGVFSVISKQRWHRSNIYSAAPMPYMQRITWSGIALHAGVVPGHPASHGCIRLKNDFAVRLWHLTKRGTRVIIAHGDVQPVEITDPHLFQPKAASASSEFQAATVATKSIGTAAATQGSQVSNAETPEAASLQVPGSVPAASAPKKIVPISIFVSRKLSKLFVRQGFTPLFDVPVKIENPEEPLGTHVFTAMEFQNEEAAIRWTVVSIPDEFPRIAGATKGREAPVKQTAPSVPSPDQANAVLNRIEIPQDTVERISKLLTPASSLIISDNGFSNETGKDTDFIVVTH